MLYKQKHIYGSSRVGMDVAEKDMITPAITEQSFYRESGKKQYELSNHLGNVLTVITDKKQAVESTTTTGTVDYFVVEILTASDYSPFGVLLQNREFTSAKYRYGFNGQERDDEVKGEGNNYDYGERQYDPRVARFLTIDGLADDYPWYTPYQFAGNKPIWAIDLDGLEEFFVNRYDSKNGYKYQIVRNPNKEIAQRDKGKIQWVYYSMDGNKTNSEIKIPTDDFEKYMINKINTIDAAVGGKGSIWAVDFESNEIPKSYLKQASNTIIKISIFKGLEIKPGVSEKRMGNNNFISFYTSGTDLFDWDVVKDLAEAIKKNDKIKEVNFTSRVYSKNWQAKHLEYRDNFHVLGKKIIEKLR
jgi:RHS repeat-associated protein